MPRTAFDPAQDGFAFPNDFDSRPVGDLSIRGLCGGMVYTVLDYLAADIPCPRGPRPADGTPLHEHLSRRNVDAWTANLDKWAELTVNPLGARNGEFFRWGWELKPGARIDELRRSIDAGRNVPLGLFSHEDGGMPFCHHVVLGIGYDLGRYDGTNHAGDVRVDVYDPNHPDRVMRLAPDFSSELWRLEGTADAWRTYFVDLKHQPAQPPLQTPVPTTQNGLVGDLTIRICTGDDDLRGGDDNCNVIIEFTDGQTEHHDNVNRGARWVDHREQTITLPLGRMVRPNQIKMVTLETTSGGGLGGDNWNVDRVELLTAAGPLLPPWTGQPLHRFTGDNRTLMILVN